MIKFLERNWRDIVLFTLLIAMLGITAVIELKTPESTLPSDNIGHYFSVVGGWEDEEGTRYTIAATENGVQYMIIEGGAGYGITPLYNPDGSLKVLE